MDGGYAEVMIAGARGIWLRFLTSSRPWRLLHSSVRVLRPTTCFAMQVCAVGIWSRCRALVVLGIWVSSLRDTWGFRTVAIGRGQAIRKSLRRTWVAHVYIDTAVDDAAAVLQRMGGARAILATDPQ